jgi:F-type H+-transporting ATPase subunit delta
MTNRPKQYAKILLDILKEIPKEDYNTLFENFAKYLDSEGYIGLFPEIEKELTSLLLKEEGVKEAEIRVARENVLEPSILEKIREISRGQKLSIKTTTDPELIGGFSIRFGDNLLDGSVRKKLQNLERVLQN